MFILYDKNKAVNLAQIKSVWYSDDQLLFDVFADGYYIVHKDYETRFLKSLGLSELKPE